MKNLFNLCLLISLFLSCSGGKENEKENLNEEEKAEMEVVEKMQEKEKHDADSVKKYWEDKMKKSGPEEEEKE